MNDIYALAGVAIRFDQFGRATDHAPPMAAARRCFSLVGTTRLLFDHDGRAFASTRDGSLVLWQDNYGLFFTAAMAVNRVNAGLVRMIRCGDLRGVSVRFSDDRQSEMTPDGELVSQSSLPEVSVVGDPAQDGTGVWITDEDSTDLSPAIRAARSRWQASAMARNLPPRPVARRQPDAAILARIDRIVTEARPDLQEYLP